jgi:hypothetical protein
MRKLWVPLIVLPLGLATAGPADKPAQPAASTKVRTPGDAPAIQLADAVAQATAYARKHDLMSGYLRSASFDPVKRRWSVVWQSAIASEPDRPGGTKEIQIYESGTIDVVLRTPGYGEGPTPAVRPSQPSAPTKLHGAGHFPAVQLADAVAQATAYARTKQIDLSRAYLQSAGFDPVKRRWSVVWQEPNARGGTTEIRIDESGTIDVQYGE